MFLRQRRWRRVLISSLRQVPDLPYRKELDAPLTSPYVPRTLTIKRNVAELSEPAFLSPLDLCTMRLVAPGPAKRPQ